MRLLPLLLSYAQIAIIDDDPEYVKALAITIPSQFNTSLHLHPRTFDEVMRVSSAHLLVEQQRFYAIVQAQHEEGGLPLKLVLQYLASSTRFEITAVAIADFSMPSENGVSLMKRHKYLGLQRILLTGQADNELAVKSFNAGAIEMFVPKQADDLLHKVIEGLELHLKVSSEIRGQVLSQALPSSLVAALRNRRLANEVAAYLTSIGVVEYVMLGRPMGFVALKADGSTLWIQIEDEASLVGLVELLDEAHWPSHDIDSVRAREAAVCIEWANQIPGFVATCEKLHKVSQTPFLGLATFPLTSLPVDLRPLTHQEWLKAHSNPREV